MKTKIYAYAFILLFLSTALACKQRRHAVTEIVTPDTTITEETSFNNLFLDSTALQSFIDSNKQFAPYKDYFMAFYKQRNFEFAWFDSSGLIEQTSNLINIINDKITEVNDSSLYDKKLFTLYQKYKGNQAFHRLPSKDVLQSELYFTGSFFKYISQLYDGQDLNAEQMGWFIPRKKLDLTGLLDSTLSNNNNPNFSNLLNPAYKELSSFLVSYQKIKKEFPHWRTLVLNTKKLQLNDENAIIPSIKKRLFLFGDMPEEDTSSLYDTQMLKGVKSYQQRMGLGADGVIGNGFVRSINTPIDTLIKTILINVERTRWLPSSIPNTRVWVNIPEYRLHVYDNSEPLFSMRVIVGSAAHGTVIFSGNLKYVVFAPYWNVPSSIVQKEIMPGIERNSNYIANHGMEITGYKKSGEPIVRQLPGENNALGTVKFLFPNDYDIYLHDTPNRDLFSSSNRSLSHGCIRLAEPPKMARFLLRNDSTKYSAAIIDSLMHKNKVETWVTVKPAVPVYLVYFTAWVDDDGKLNFRNDIYGHDKKVAAKLFK